MKSLAKKVNGFKPLTIFTKHSILDVWQGSEFISGLLKLLCHDSKRDTLLIYAKRRLWPLIMLCVFVCVCMISNHSTSEKPHVSDCSKHDALLHKTNIKVLLVPRPNMFRSILSLRKIAHQMWDDHHSAKETG